MARTSAKAATDTSDDVVHDDVLEVASGVRQAVSRLHRRFRKLAPTGVTSSRLQALSLVDRTGPLSMRALADAEGVAAPTMTRIVDSLEREGFVTRLADVRDRRVSRIAITPKGRRLLGGARHQVDRALAYGLGRLSRPELDQLRAALPALERLAEHTAP
jgi:DNA-binding MarR family transcriptional regulator